jgi:hypothetical protein
MWDVCTCQAFRPSAEEERQNEDEHAPLLPEPDVDPVQDQPAGLMMPPRFPPLPGGKAPSVRGYDVGPDDELDPGPKPEPSLQPPPGEASTGAGQADEAPGPSGGLPSTPAPQPGDQNPGRPGRIATEDSTTEGWVEAAAGPDPRARPASRGTFTPGRPSALNEAGRSEARRIEAERAEQASIEAATSGGPQQDPGPTAAPRRRRLAPPPIERLQRRQGARALQDYRAAVPSPAATLRAREDRYRKREADFLAADEKLQRREGRLLPRENALRTREAEILAEDNRRRRDGGRAERELGSHAMDTLPARPPRTLPRGGLPGPWNGPTGPGEEAWGEDHRAWQMNLDAWSMNLRAREKDFTLREKDYRAWKAQIELAEDAARRRDEEEELDDVMDLEELDDDYFDQRRRGR